MFQSSNPKPTHLKVKRLCGSGLEESEQRHLVPYRHGVAVLTNHTVALAAAAAMAMLMSCFVCWLVVVAGVGLCWCCLLACLLELACCLFGWLRCHVCLSPLLSGDGEGRWWGQSKRSCGCGRLVATSSSPAFHPHHLLSLAFSSHQAIIEPTLPFIIKA